VSGTGMVGNDAGAELDESLKLGDTIEFDVEDLGVLRNQVA